MPDYGHIYADKKISEVNKQLKSVYRQAQREMKKKLADFNKRYASESKRRKKMVEEGKISEEDYKDWLAGRVFIQRNWQNKIDQVNKILNDHNNQAMKLINQGKMDTFAENYNFQAYLAEKKMVGTFSLYNAEAVSRLMLDDPDLLPEWKIDQKKDYTWNRKKANNIVTQGIIQGMGVPDITKRLCDGLQTQNEDRMRTFARTAMTAAENAGRQRQMDDAADMGIEVHKKWEATHDRRTRDSHRAVDGEEVPHNESFSNGLEFPGDPHGEPSEVYNCRCTMVTVYPKYEDRQASAKRYEDMSIDGQSYGEWKKYDSYEDWKAAKTKEQDVDPYSQHKDKSYVELLDSLDKEKRREMEKAIQKNKTWQYTYAEYWNKLKTGQLTDKDVERILGNGNMPSDAVHETKALSEKEKKEALELYRTFVEGGSSEIHKLAGYKEFGGGYDPKSVDEQKMKLLDTVFNPAKESFTVYKGQPMTQDEIDEMIRNKGFFNHTLSSTSLSEETAKAYMDNASEEFGTLPVFMNIKVSKDVPIASAMDLLGTDGMKLFEKEITIGRNVEWELTSIEVKNEGQWNEYYEANVTLRKVDKKDRRKK